MLGNSPNANLSLSDPNCTDESCQAFLNAENESQAAVSWAFQFQYGHWVTYYYVIIIGLLLLIHISRAFMDRRATSRSSKLSTSMYQRAIALGRYVSYRRFTGNLLAWFGFPSFGMLAFFITTLAFLAALVFAIKPY